MSFHRWGDGFEFFDDVEDAARYIGQFLRRWGRMSVTDAKEKFGQVRVYCDLGWFDLHTLVFPGYAWFQWDKKYWTANDQTRKIMRLLNYIVVPYHKWLYRLAYKKAIKLYPHIVDEIIGGADYPELLRKLK